MTQPLTHQDVAAEIRAQFARRRLTGRKAAAELGWTGPYLSRRLTGAVPFNVTDLAAIAQLLDLPVSMFFEMGPGARKPGTSPPARRPVRIAA